VSRVAPGLLVGLAAPAGIAMAVLGVAAASLLLLAIGDAGAWWSHGVRPAQASLAAWVVLFLATWTLMTGAMMLPSSLPFLLAAHRVGGKTASTMAGLGFTAVWLAVGAIECSSLWAAAELLAALAPGHAEQLAGASLVAAAAYQLSPIANACQRACARPFAILARHVHGTGSSGREALAAGVHYGASCIGCCMPMIVVMFVVGTHDLTWIAALALLMVIQKHAVWGARIALPAAVALALCGIAIGIGWWAPPLYSLRALCVG
jgi:predicted metal-binding membrane protein